MYQRWGVAESAFRILGSMAQLAILVEWRVPQSLAGGAKTWLEKGYGYYSRIARAGVTLG